jgi:hypothetical protein
MDTLTASGMQNWRRLAGLRAAAVFHPGKQRVTAEQLQKRSQYPRPDSEYPRQFPTLVPHLSKHGAQAFAITIPEQACAELGAVQGAFAVSTRM